MKYLIILFLISGLAQAVPLKLMWNNPTEREDNSELDISYGFWTRIYQADCDTGDVSGELFKVISALTYKIWDGELGSCVRLTITDIEGRESRFSKIMIPWDANQPKQPGCK